MHFSVILAFPRGNWDGRVALQFLMAEATVVWDFLSFPMAFPLILELFCSVSSLGSLPAELPFGDWCIFLKEEY